MMRNRKKKDKTGCYDCGIEYGGDGWVETLLPKKVWNEIRPEGTVEGGGILCISCICRRLKQRGMKDVPVIICGTEPIVVLPYRPLANDLIEKMVHQYV